MEGAPALTHAKLSVSKIESAAKAAQGTAPVDKCNRLKALENMAHAARVTGQDFLDISLDDFALISVKR